MTDRFRYFKCRFHFLIIMSRAKQHSDHTIEDKQKKCSVADALRVMNLISVKSANF